MHTNLTCCAAVHSASKRWLRGSARTWNDQHGSTTLNTHTTTKTSAPNVRERRTGRDGVPLLGKTPNPTPATRAVRPASWFHGCKLEPTVRTTTAARRRRRGAGLFTPHGWNLTGLEGAAAITAHEA